MEEITWSLDDYDEDAYVRYIGALRQSCISGQQRAGVDLLREQVEGELITVDYTFGGGKIVKGAYTPHNLYLVGYQDGKKQWWEFLNDKESHERYIAGSKFLSFGCNYMDMGDLEEGMQVGRMSCQNAIANLWKENITDEEKKKHLKVLIVTGPESARLDPVFKLVDEGFRNWDDKGLSVAHVEMIKNGSNMCGMLSEDGFELSPEHPLVRIAEVDNREKLVSSLKLCLR